MVKDMNKSRRWTLKYLSDRKIQKLEEAVIRKYGRVCEICGYTDKEWTPVIHHRDCNRNNNSIKNLMCICYPCHAYIHAKYPNWYHLKDDEILNIISEGYKLLGIVDFDLKYIIEQNTAMEEEIGNLKYLLRILEKHHKGVRLTMAIHQATY